MEDELSVSSPSGSLRLLCYCWKCYAQANFLQDFGSIQEYRCPKCFVRIRLGDPEYFDPLRTADDDSDSVSVCVSPSESRRSTITYSESEAGASDDVDTRPLTPESFNLSVPTVPANTPVVEVDVPDAPPNIADAFADVTSFLLNVPTPQRRSQRFSFGGLSSVGGPDSVSPSKMIENLMQAYKRCSLGANDCINKPEEMVHDRLGQGIEIRITASPDTNELKPGSVSRKVSATDISYKNSETDKDFERD